MELGKEVFKENYQHKAEDTNIKLHQKEFLSNYRKSLRQIKTDFETKIKHTASEGIRIMARHGLTHEDFAYKTTNTFEKIINGKFEVSNRFIGFAEDVSNCYTKTKPKDIKEAIENAYRNGLQKSFSDIVAFLQVDIVVYNSAIMVLKYINTLGILSDLALQIKKLTDEQNTMLISDTNMLLNKIIDNSDAPFVYEKTGINIENFMIDEFQDTSTLQWKNFQPLLDNSLSAGKFNLVVGDVKQSIYRWRNSDWKLLDEQLLTDFRPEQLHEENLETNWRSDKNIVDFNNSFFYRAAQLLQAKLAENLAPILPQNPHLELLNHKIEHAYANIHQKVSPKAGVGHVQITFIPKDENEEGWKVESLNRLPLIIEKLQSQGYRPNDICILVRKNDEEQSVIRKILNYKTTPAAKPEFCYDIMGNDGLLVGSAAAVRFILGLLQMFVNPDDSIQQTIINYEYARGMLKKTENEALNMCFSSIPSATNSYSHLFSESENEQLNNLKNSSLFDMVERIITLFGIGSWHNEAVFLQAFQDVVFRFSTNKTADLNSFLNWWKTNGEKQCIATPDTQNAMRIMTVHKSKGLDFKVVIMPFCDWDIDSKMKNILWCKPSIAPFDELPLLPVEYSTKLSKSIFADNYFDEQMHLYIDSLNVAYVAFTRAKNELICIVPTTNKENVSLDKMGTLSALMSTCFEVNTVEAKDDKIALSNYYTKETGVFELGEPTTAVYKDAPSHISNENVNSYPSASTTNRLRIRHQSVDFNFEEVEMADNKLNYGIIMHDVLRQIKYKSDQSKAIAEMLRSGRINMQESEIVENEMNQFWNIPETENWFSADLNVLNEATILMPDGQNFRPDRVAIRQNLATIIDYKFGGKEDSKYLQQVKQYMNLVSSMGYQTEGFVCYVSLKKVVRV